MKTCLVIVFVTTVVMAAEKYTSRYDHIDVDSILRNDRLLNNYIKCIVDNGPCTTEARELKTDLPEALRTECEKCTEKQKQMVRKAARYLISERPQQWEKVVNKFDPDKKYGEVFTRFLNSE